MKGIDLLNIFPDFNVCAGHKGLNNIITTITVMDAPDIYNWMKGGEFLITSGYSFKDCPEKFASLLLNLKEKNVSALGIKTNRFINKLPDVVIETSNKINLPVINIPDHYAFSDIINSGLTSLVNDQYDELLQSEKIHNEFINMGIHNTEIDNVLDRLQKFIKKDILYFDIKDNKIYSTSNSSFKDIVLSNLDNIKNLSNDKIYIHDVFNGQGLHGYIIINSNINELSNLDLRTIEYAQTMIIFHIQKEFSNKQIVENYKDKFILDILLNNIKSDEEIINRSKMHNWNLNSNMFCLIFDIDNFKLNYQNDTFQLNTEKTRDLIHEDIISMMQKLYKDSYYMSKSDSIVYIVNYERNDLADFEKSLDKINITIKEKHGYSLTICIGNRHENIRDLYKSYQECLICLKRGTDLFKTDSNIIKYHDISIYWNLLNSLKDNGYENDPIVSQLNDLKASDKLNNTEYYDSIKSIIRCDWNLKEASKEMFIHYNTIKYRYVKIKKLLNNNLNNRTSKLKIELALYMFELLSD